ncbi:MAG: CBS domain-containing protein [Planctomycetota bacterium]|jgi:CBS domain-containing protein
MKDNVVTVGPQTPMSRLQEILREKRISGAPVLDKNKLVGIISIDDFIRWLAERQVDCPISEKMTSEVQTLINLKNMVLAVSLLSIARTKGSGALLPRETLLGGC